MHESVDLAFIRPENRKSAIYIKFGEALHEFLEGMQLHEDEALIVCGSFAKNSLSDSSDIDMVYVCNPDHLGSEAFKKSVCKGIRISVFQFSRKELEQSFQNEKGGIDRQRSSLISSGVFIKGNMHLAQTIIGWAQEGYNAPLPEIVLEHAKSMVNFISSSFPEEMSMLMKSSTVGFALTVNGMLEKYLNLIYQMDGKLLPQHKKMGNDLSTMGDRDCARLFCNTVLETDAESKFNHFRALSEKVSEKLRVYARQHYHVELN